MEPLFRHIKQSRFFRQSCASKVLPSCHIHLPPSKLFTLSPPTPTYNPPLSSLSDPGKALDQAREAAIADARRKAGVYARAAEVTLGRLVSIEEESGSSAPVPMRVLAQPAGTQMPIVPGENTLRATVTVSFEIAGQ